MKRRTNRTPPSLKAAVTPKSAPPKRDTPSRLPPPVQTRPSLIPEDLASFNSAIRDVRSVAAKCLDSRLKREMETNKVRALGGHVRKQAKCAFPVLKEQRRRWAEALRHDQEEAKNTGVSIRANMKYTGYFDAMRKHKEKAAFVRKDLKFKRANNSSRARKGS